MRYTARYMNVHLYWATALWIYQPYSFEPEFSDSKLREFESGVSVQRANIGNVLSSSYNSIGHKVTKNRESHFDDCLRGIVDIDPL